MTRKTTTKKATKTTKAKKTPATKKTETSRKAEPPKVEPKEVPKEILDPRVQKILGDRARELADIVETEEDTEDIVEVVEFVLSYEKYAIESVHVDEVYPMKEFTTLPGAPPFVLGIINLRGAILSVVDIRRYFNLPVEGISNLNRVVVVNTPKMRIGILADFILGVRSISKNRIQASLPTLTGLRAEYIKGVTEDRLVILDINRIVNDRRIIVHQTVE